MRTLTREQARQIAVRAQLLDSPRPTDVHDVVRHLTMLQIDPTAAVAPNVDLVLFSRIGRAYSPRDLTALLEDQTLLEHRGAVRPAENLALYRADMALWPGPGELRDWQMGNEAWVEANDDCRVAILDRLRADGPLPSRELPDLCEVPWRSTGWTNNKNVTRLLEFMVERGEVAISGRQGRERLWDLAGRIHPDVPVPPSDEARRRRHELRLRSLGVARPKAPQLPGEYDVGEAGEPAVIEGVRGRWRVDPELLDGVFTGRTALLSPFDRLIADRKRMQEIFEFDYQLEMFKPAAKRRFGYFALPILHGDRLIGKLDATADRDAGVLRVDAVHSDVEFTSEIAAAVDAEIEDLSMWIGRGAA